MACLKSLLIKLLDIEGHLSLDVGCAHASPMSGSATVVQDIRSRFSEVGCRWDTETPLMAVTFRFVESQFVFGEIAINVNCTSAYDQNTLAAIKSLCRLN